ncbi:MAG: hypothetical protein WAM27_06450 [Nitrososphaeraceae archaeon]
MKKSTVLMAAVLAVATVLAAGLAVLPSSVQDAQANPCSENTVAQASSTDTGGEAKNQGAQTIICNLNGVDINEKTVQPPVGVAEEESAEETEDAGVAEEESAEDAEFE